jgi:DNA processing protein
VAIVGAREASPRGRRLAWDLGAQAARAGVVVVSGGARGIDVEAHRGALENGGRTIAVLGEAVRKDGGDERPLRARRLLKTADAAARALMLTTYGPFQPPQAWWFAARNKHVARIADHVVVVEGAAGSGTKHTLQAAASFGRTVWAIAGDDDAPLSRTPNAWLEEHHARWLHVDRQPIAAMFGDAPTAADDGPVGSLLALVRARGGRVLLDDACRTLAMPTSTLLAEALALELDGRLVREGGTLVARHR